MRVTGLQERTILLPGQGGTVRHARLITQLKLLTLQVSDGVIEAAQAEIVFGQSEFYSLIC